MICFRLDLFFLFWFTSQDLYFEAIRITESQLNVSAILFEQSNVGLLAVKDICSKNVKTEIEQVRFNTYICCSF